MTDMTKEEVIEALERLKTTHMGDFGWDSAGIKALEFAILSIHKVEWLDKMVDALEDENEQLYNKGYENALAKVKNIIDFYEINIDSSQGPRPINNTSKHHVYEAMSEIEHLVRR